MTIEIMPKTQLPAGPELPFDMHTTAQTFACLQQWINEYDSIFRLTQDKRSAPAFVINDAEALKHILIGNHRNYLKGVVFERVKMLLGNGIIVSDGEFWRRQRRMIQPAFSRDVIAQVSEQMKDCNLRLLQQWSRSEGEAIDITQLTNELALEIVLRAIFSDDFDSGIMQDGKNPFAILTDSSIRDLQLAVKFRALGKTVQAVIDHRRAENLLRVDFLDSMINARDKDSGEPMSDREMIDEVMTLIVAGSETSAATMNWVWFIMSQHAHIEAGVQAEIDALDFDQAPSFSQLSELKYLRQVIDEALRLYPPVWLYSRKAIADDQVAGVKIPAGADIFISPYFLHRNKQYWDDPDKVDPGRFDETTSKQRHKLAYIPFSAGPRRCIGDFFGIVEVQMHFAILARCFRLGMAPQSQVALEAEVNLRPANPFIMTLHKRP